jgi:hypothetical protein
LFQLVVLKRSMELADASATSERLEAGKGFRLGGRSTTVWAIALLASATTQAASEPKAIDRKWEGFVLIGVVSRVCETSPRWGSEAQVERAARPRDRANRSDFLLLRVRAIEICYLQISFFGSHGGGGSLVSQLKSDSTNLPGRFVEALSSVPAPVQ